jgi:hypothetical protein
VLEPLYIPIDGRQSPTALAVQRGTSRLLRQLGFAVLPEVTLATGRRADLMALGSDGLVWIVEIKSSYEDFKVDQKWPEYRDYCDRFCFAIPTTLAPEIFPDSAGLIIADNWGADIVRQVADHPLHASRRKAVTLLFGRLAAQRLHGLYDP